MFKLDNINLIIYFNFNNDIIIDGFEMHRRYTKVLTHPKPLSEQKKYTRPKTPTNNINKPPKFAKNRWCKRKTFTNV